MIISLSSCSTSRTLRDLFNFDERLESIQEDDESSLGEVKARNNTYFIDRAQQYGLKDIKAYNINVIDLNGDNYSDIVVIPSFYSEPVFYYYNIFDKKFEKRESPFKGAIKASYLLFYDLNNDTVLDAIVGVLNQKTEMSKEPLKIFYGKKDKLNNLSFIESKHKLPAGPNSSLGMVDYNLDGKLDLFVGNWFGRYKENPLAKPDHFLVNTGAKFVDKTNTLVGERKKNPSKAMFINATPTYAVQVCDMDQNGYPDILTTSTNQFANKMWMNRYRFREKKRYFENQAVVSGFAADSEGLINTQGGGRTFALACADYNNDGIMDVFLGELSHNYDNDGIDRSSVLTGRTLKETPRFYRTEYTQDSFDPNWHQADRRAIWVDLNNDGLQDLIVDNSGYPPYTRLVFFEQLPDHSFVNKSAEYGIDIMNPISTVTLDVNRDGKMDILTSQSLIRNESITPRLYLFENNIQNENKGIRFYLRGSRANYHGINATVTMKVMTEFGIENRMQNVSYSYGALPSQNEEGILFGLKPTDKVIHVKVRWPYAVNLNESRNIMERTYKIDEQYEDTINITLCETGEYLVGRRECFF